MRFKKVSSDISINLHAVGYFWMRSGTGDDSSEFRNWASELVYLTIPVIWYEPLIIFIKACRPLYFIRSNINRVISIRTSITGGKIGATDQRKPIDAFATQRNASFDLFLLELGSRF
ncbi:MAG: hypothetical protein U5K54_07395 [Cytophagales bacterium]|nr:hypothetical protein [Cytophagales bacterium]